MRIAAQQHAKIIEPGNDPLELYTIDEEHSNGGLVLADMIQKHVLNIL
jgi:hypothetical protein